MSLWPELRSAYRAEHGGDELAHQTLGDFVGYTLYYAINGPDMAHRKREALLATLDGEPVVGVDGVGVQEATSSLSMLGELDQLDQHIHSGVE